MKILLAVLLTLATVAPAQAATPLHVIFDTDMGNDVDDALALAMLHAFASRGEVNLLAVTVSKDNPWAVEYVRLVNEYYAGARSRLVSSMTAKLRKMACTSGKFASYVAATPIRTLSPMRCSC